MEYWTEEKLQQKVNQMQKRYKPRKGKLLGQFANDFFKKKISKRHKRLQQISEVWQELLPQEILEHSCIDDLSRGVLRITVDSHVHYAELDMLVRSGLADQILEAAPSLPAFKIKLSRGKWYHLDEEGNKIADW